MASEIFHRPGQTADPASAVVPQMFSKMLLASMYNDLGIFQRFVNFSAEVAEAGESVRVPILPHTEAVNVSMTDGTYTNQVVTPTKETITINKWKALPYRIVDSVQWQNNVALESKLALDGGKSVREAADEDVLAEIDGISNSVGAYTTAISETILTQAFEKLMEARLRPDMNPLDFTWILPHTALHQIKNSAYFAAQYYTGDQVGGGSSSLKVSSLFKIPVFFVYSANLLHSGDARFGVLAHKEAFGVAMQSNPRYIDKGYVNGALAKEYVVDCLYGVEALRPDYACKVLLNGSK